MKQTWVLDTNILYCAARCGKRGCKQDDFEASTKSLMLLTAVTQRHSVAEDSAGRMATEYRRAWQRIANDKKEYPTFVAVHALWDASFSRSHFRGERRLPEALRQRAKLGNMKTDGDIAFIEAANATADKLLASEDSDFSPELRRELVDAPGVGVRVLRASEALLVAWP